MNTVILSKQQRQEIGDKYKNGASKEKLAKEYSTNSHRIDSVLRKLGIPLRVYYKYNLIPHGEVIKLYNSGKNIKELKAYFKCDRMTLYRILWNNKVEMRDGRIYKIRHDFLSKIDHQDKAYILGFLLSDEHLSKQGNCNSQVILTQGLNDKKILEEIRDIIYPNKDKPLYQAQPSFSIYNGYKIEGKGSWILSFSSKKFCNDFKKFRPNNKKSSTKFLPELDKNLYSHLLRGLLDGDGSIYLVKSGIAAEISLHKEFAIDIQRIIKNELNIESKIYPYYNRDNSPIDRLRIINKDDVTKFLHWIYKDVSLKLDRKYKIYEKYFAESNSIR